MKYKIILSDCPWQYQNWTDKKNGAAKAHYKQLNLTQLCNLPIDSITEKDSLCFMWATFPKLDEAMKVLEAWGYKYITAPFVWNKVYEKTGKPYCGLGFWSRSGAELVLMGKRGKGVPRLKTATNVKQVITAPVTRPHSSKPPELHDRIIELVGDQPRVELFGRKKVTGWEVLGNEIDGKDINDAIADLAKK